MSPLISELPPALDEGEALRQRIAGRRLALFLDFDGTISPIVEEPGAAALAPGNRERLERLGEVATVCLVSGRDLGDLRGRVGVDGLYYAGSHGFEVEGPGGMRHVYEEGARFLPTLDEAERALRAALEGVPGIFVERKRYAIAVHDRRVPAEHLDRVRQVVDEEAARRPTLRLMRGKRVHELRPEIEWDKGRAMLWLLQELGLPRDEIALLYVGDDTTDEDAFRVLRRDVDGEGNVEIGVVVGEEDRETLAHYMVAGPAEASDLLDRLAEWAARPGEGESRQS